MKVKRILKTVGITAAVVTVAAAGAVVGYRFGVTSEINKYIIKGLEMAKAAEAATDML